MRTTAFITTSFAVPRGEQPAEAPLDGGSVAAMRRDGRGEVAAGTGYQSDGASVSASTADAGDGRVDPCNGPRQLWLCRARYLGSGERGSAPSSSVSDARRKRVPEPLRDPGIVPLSRRS